MNKSLIFFLATFVAMLAGCTRRAPTNAVIPIFKEAPAQAPRVPAPPAQSPSTQSPPAQAAAPQAIWAPLKEYWIGPTAKTKNLGTRSEPFDASTRSNFDSLLPRLSGPCIIHLLPGIYWTWGSYARNHLNPGVQLIGAGMYNTIVRVDTNAPVTTGGAMDILYTEWSYYSNNVISDLTVDGNYPGFVAAHKTNLIINGVLLNGTHQRISRVRTVNLMTCTNIPGMNPEGWSLTIGTGGALQTHACEGEVIENCVVTKFYGPNQTDGIAFISDQATKATISGIIRGNTVSGVIEAFNGAWMINSQIVGNQVSECYDGLYGDTGSYSNLVVSGNTFDHVVWGARFPCNGTSSLRRDKLTFTHNRYRLKEGGAMIAIGTPGVGSTPPPFFDLVIAGNIINQMAGAKRNGRVATVRGVQGLTIAGNKVNPLLLSNQILNCKRVAISNNVDLSGVPLRLR